MDIPNLLLVERGGVIGELFPYIIGIAISPVQIIAVILIVVRPNARTVAAAFAAGWFLALLAVTAIVMAVADAGDASSDLSASDTVYVIKLILGLIFVYLALRQWHGRPQQGEEPKMPDWMGAIDSLGQPRAFGLGALLASANPKVLALTIAAGATIAQAGLASGDMWLVLIVFAALASVTVIGPVAYYFLAGESGERVLSEVKEWLVANSATIVFIVLIVIGVVLIGEGMGGLTA